MSRCPPLLLMWSIAACSPAEAPPPQTPSAAPAPAPPPSGSDAPGTALLRGTYAYMADAGLFKDCRSGKTLPVSQTADAAALERAYLAAQSAPGAPLLVTFEGHFEEAPPAEEGSARHGQVVVVDRFDRVWPGATCDEETAATDPGTGPAIEGTRWKLAELRGQPALGVDGDHGPHLELDAAKKQARGSGGCNSFFGSYELGGDTLRFGDLASTRRACLDAALNGQETAFLQALGETRRWQIGDGGLVLSDDSGPLLRFVRK